MFSYSEDPKLKIALCSIIAVLVGLLFWRRRPWRTVKNLPPGPSSITIIWNIIFKRFDHEMLIQLKETHGNIFSVSLGCQTIILLAHRGAIETALTNPHLQGRTDFITFRSMRHDRNIGIINSEGDPWRKSRKFAMRTLGSLGLSNRRMEYSINVEILVLLEHIRERRGAPVVLDTAINICILNIVWQLVATRRYEIDDPEMTKFMELLKNVLSVFEGPINIVSFIPKLEKVFPRCLMNKLGLSAMLEVRNELKEFTMNEILRHERSDDPEEPKDYIDRYLAQIQAEANDPNSHFNPDKMDLVVSIIDLFFAGSETTSSTIKWFLIFMAKYPRVQQKIYNNINDVVQLPTVPSLEDIPQLNYLEASLRETLRLSSLVPFGLPHVATANTHVLGYDVPKGSILFPCLEACHKSVDTWERPHDFYPEHFLDADGLLSQPKTYMPFSIGTRRCLGESLAKMELFLVAGNILQRFKVLPGENFDKQWDARKRGLRLLNIPPNVDLVFVDRK